MERLMDDELAQLLWDYHVIQQPLRLSDCLLVLGCSDTRVAEYAAELYRQGWAPLVVFCGGVGKITKSAFSRPEAEVFAQIAHQLGVPKCATLVENRSTNTGENLQFSRELLSSQGIQPERVCLVHKPYAQRRALATCAKVWSEVEVTVTGPPIGFADYPNNSIAKELVINLMVGDTQRIRLYAEIGFQVPQPMPDWVWQAYEELVRRGYSDYLLQPSPAMEAAS